MGGDGCGTYDSMLFWKMRIRSGNGIFVPASHRKWHLITGEAFYLEVDNGSRNLKELASSAVHNEAPESMAMLELENKNARDLSLETNEWLAWCFWVNFAK